MPFELHFGDDTSPLLSAHNILLLSACSMNVLACLSVKFGVRLMWIWLSYRDIARLDCALCSTLDRTFLTEAYKLTVLRYEAKQPAKCVPAVLKWLVKREIKLSMLSLSVPLPADEVRQPLISLIITSSTKLLAAQIKNNNLLVYSIVNALTCTCPCLKILSFM